MTPFEIGLNAEKFEFMLLALDHIIKPVLGHDKFEITIRKDPESQNVTVSYLLDE